MRIESLLSDEPSRNDRLISTESLWFGGKLYPSLLQDFIEDSLCRPGNQKRLYWLTRQVPQHLHALKTDDEICPWTIDGDPQPMTLSEAIRVLSAFRDFVHTLSKCPDEFLDHCLVLHNDPAENFPVMKHIRLARCSRKERNYLHLVSIAQHCSVCDSAPPEFD